MTASPQMQAPVEPIEETKPVRRRGLLGRRRGPAGNRPVGTQGTGPVDVGGGRTRSPLRIGLALLTIAVVGALAGLLYTRSNQGIAVVVAAKTMPAGHVITAADLVQGQISASDQEFTAVKWTNASTLVGKVTTSRIPQATLLAEEMVGSRIALPPKTQAVGLKVPAGQIPAEVIAGSRVLVVSVPARSASGGSGGTTLTTGTVISVVADQAGSGASLVTVAVPTRTAAKVAATGATGQVALVLAGR